MLGIRRREFITILGGVAAPGAVFLRAARAQQDARVRRIGILIAGGNTDPGTGWQSTDIALRTELPKLGWIEGHNVRFDFRFASNDLGRLDAYAAELVSLSPDIILASPVLATKTLQQRTKTIRVIFAGAGDPVVDQLVQSIARPEGNITGFSNFEPTIAGKWLQSLKEAAPHVSRVALVFHPEFIGLSEERRDPLPRVRVGPSYIEAIEAAALSLSVQTIKMPARNAVDVVHAIDSFAAEPNGGLLVLPAINALAEPIIQLATHHKLPAIFPTRPLAVAGGLMSYGPEAAERARGIAAYVDRLLRGAKVSELPVQFPTKFELVVNLKTAKAMGLTIPESFLLRANELIE